MTNNGNKPETAPPVMNPVLVNSPLFSSMSGPEYGSISAFLEQRHVKKGETIFNEGDHGAEMFILYSGSLIAFKKQSDGTQRRMFTIPTGDFFGEMSIIANEPRSATISAIEDSELMGIKGTDFFRIVFEYPMLGIKLLNSISTVQCKWLNQNSKYLRDLIQWGEKARRRAITDELTELYNRNFLEETIRDRFTSGSVGARNLSLIMMDLDKVHEINNRYGNAGGDKVIIAVADILKKQSRSGDIAARLSGDEFSVLLPDTGSTDAFDVAEKIRKTVSECKINLVRLGTGETDELSTRTSLGIAAAPKHADNVRDLMYYADMALHQAKENGRDRVELYKPS